jgi:hypothetical protein
MDFLQGQSTETMVAVAVVAVAAGGAFLLLRSKKPKGTDMHTHPPSPLSPVVCVRQTDAIWFAFRSGC